MCYNWQVYIIKYRTLTMKLLFDFFPILIFFIAFKFGGIYVATGSFLIAACIQMAIYWLMHRRFEKMHVITFILGMILGGATLLLHDIMFIKWKPTAIYWGFALVFFFTQIFSKKTLIQTMMESNISLPQMVWKKLNMAWGIFFLLMGFANLYVVYNFDTNTWVNFKLFGLLGLTLAFVIIQAVYLSRHIRTEETNT